MKKTIQVGDQVEFAYAQDDKGNWMTTKGVVEAINGDVLSLESNPAPSKFSSRKYNIRRKDVTYNLGKYRPYDGKEDPDAEYLELVYQAEQD